jgi:hypothetical protein
VASQALREPIAPAVAPGAQTHVVTVASATVPAPTTGAPRIPLGRDDAPIPATLKDERDLESYLTLLRERGESDPELARWDIENGLEAINHMTEQLGVDRATARAQAFVNEQRALAAEANADVTPEEIGPLVERFKATTDVAERDRIARRYFAAVAQLSPIERVIELQRAEQFVR